MLATRSPATTSTASYGTMQHDSTTAGQYRSAYLTDVAARDIDVTFRLKTDSAPPSGGFLFGWVALRRGDSGTGTQYLGRITLSPSGVTLQAYKVAAVFDATTCPSAPCQPVSLSPDAGAPQAHFTPGNFIWVHAQALGGNPTTLRLRAWDDGQSEPATWSVQTTDSEPTLQGAGSVGLRSFVAGSLASGQTITFGFDDFRATSSDGSPTATPTSTLTPTPIPTGHRPARQRRRHADTDPDADPDLDADRGTATSTPTPTNTASPPPPVTTTVRINSGAAATQVVMVGRGKQAPVSLVAPRSPIRRRLLAPSDQTLYDSERYGNTFSYGINVPNGTYTVALKFAELYWTSAGQRVFNVDDQQPSRC